MPIRLVAVILGAMTLTACTGNSPLSRDAYTREFAAALQKAAPQLRVEVIAEMQLRIVGPAGKESTAYLDNGYAEYLTDPKDKDAVFQKYIAALEEPESAHGKVDPARIVPVIKDKAWIAEIREGVRVRGSDRLPENVFEPLNDELVIVYAEDSPKNISYLTPKELQELGLKREQLRELAVRNLKRLLPKIEFHGGNGVYMLTAGGDYEASLLLFDDIWADRKLEVTGDYVVAIPSRDLLLVAGSGDEAGIAKIRALAKKSVSKASYSLIPDLFVNRDGRFVRFEEKDDRN